MTTFTDVCNAVSRYGLACHRDKAYEDWLADDSPTTLAYLEFQDTLRSLIDRQKCPNCHGTGTILVWEQRDEYGKHITLPGDSGERDDPDWQEGCDCAAGEMR